MMDAIRQRLGALWTALRALWRRATRGSAARQSLFAGGLALGLLLIIGGCVWASLPQPAAPQQLVVTRATPVPTDTAMPTATATATVTPHPTATPKPVPKTPPPPPAPPPPPPAPPTPAASGYTGGPVTNDSIFSDFCSSPTPTATSAAPTATATATAAATATSTASPATTGTSTAMGHAGLAMPQSCVSCPFTSGYNSTQSQIGQALANAASTYNLPVNLLKAVAWQESKWHEDVYSCDGGIGLMQIQYYVYPWLNGVSVSDCKLWPTNDDPYTLQGNANLGAKLLKYLSCYYSYWGGYDYDANGNPHSLSNPSKYTVDWYYHQAGLQYPDTLNADGTTNANSLCAAVFNQNGYYPALPSSTSAPWSCPYSATAGDTTLLDITISAYNEGAGNIAKYGINNMWYVNGVEGYIPQFNSGALP
ncbi:MAG TPA: transglycosylase SLT domain-containing protein [Ktedonobacterales bacterium]|nr:transglycosylase SLT domain-containing protein [Ktedonobacterales bacterium]